MTDTEVKGIIPERSPASIQRQTYRCMACQARFFHSVAFNVPVQVFIAQIESLDCPSCGAGRNKISMGENRTLAEDAADRGSGSVHRRAEHWLQTGEVGLSAKAIYARMIRIGYVVPGLADDQFSPTAAPGDLDDFRRCMLLLFHVPEWADRISDMESVSEQWERLVPAWHEIAACFLAEAPNLDRSAPKAGEMLRNALAGERLSGTVAE